MHPNRNPEYQHPQGVTKRTRRSKYVPHQGKREMARRVRQMAKKP